MVSVWSKVLVAERPTVAVTLAPDTGCPSRSLRSKRQRTVSGGIG